MSLQAAAKLLASGEEEAGLEQLVELWRAWPLPDLADAIDALAKKLAARLPPVAGVGATSDRQAFLQVAAEERTATLPRLLEALPRSNGPIARERILALGQWPVNPAIAAGMAKWLVQPPFDGKARGRCFPPTLEVIARHRDPRVVPLLQRLSSASHRSQAIRAFGLSAWKPLVALARQARDWAEPRKPTAEEVAALAALRTHLAEPARPPRAGVKVEDLFAAVRADPDDDHARLVLADLLQEAGDPRGEFIALQLARATAGGAPTKREKELLGLWGRDWLGPLNGALMREGIVFERGFLTRAAYNGAILPELDTRPEWSTVTHLGVFHAVRTARGARDLLMGPALKSLRHVIGLGLRDLQAIAERPRLQPWESLTLALWSLDRQAMEALERAPLPAVRRLGVFSEPPGALSLVEPETVATLLDTRLGRGLHHLEVAARPPAFGALIDLAGARKLTSLTLRPTSRALFLTFDVASRSVVIGLEPAREEAVDAVESALRSARPGTIDRVLLHVGKKARASLDGLKSVLRGVPLEIR